jgi:hypothetical protein
MPIHCQSAFGLNFVSEREFPELGAEAVPSELVSKFNPIALKWGTVPDRLAGAVVARGLYEASRDSFLLSVPGLARYYVAPDSITVSPFSQASDSAIRLFLFGSAIGALLHMKGILALHGSAIRLPDGEVVVITGRSTAGKSTLAMALAKVGCTPLSDDISAIHFDGNSQGWIYPGLARVKLWREALELLGLGVGNLERVREELDKFSVPVPGGATCHKLSRVYEIVPTEGRELSVDSISGIAKIELLDRQTYRRLYVADLGMRPAHLQRLANLSRQVEVSSIVRPTGRNTIAELVEIMMTDGADAG